MPRKKRSARKVQTPPVFVSTPRRERKTVLVTGASGGIGYDLSTVFAENGYDLVLVARSKEKLLSLANQAQQMFGVSALVIQKDLTDPAAPFEIARELQSKNIHVDVLVNNAGYGIFGPFAFTSNEDEFNMIHLNMGVVAAMTKLFLPEMIGRRSGKILNIASTAAFQPGPLMANYYATKAYVLSFSVALAEEVRAHGVTVSVLCPGPTPTGFQERAGIKRNPLIGFAGVDSRIVARAGYEGLIAGKTVIIPGFFNKLGATVASVMPRGLMARLIMKYQQTRA